MQIKNYGDESFLKWNLQRYIKADPKDVPPSHDYTLREFVASNTGEVISSSDGRLFTEGLFRTNIAVLMLAHKQSDGTSYLGLVHIADEKYGLPAFESTVNELREKTKSVAINAFICGGISNPHVYDAITSDDLYKNLYAKIRSLGVNLVDTQFGRCLQYAVKKEDAPPIYLADVSIARAGFDQECKPYAIYQATLNSQPLF